ncbi:MAG: PEP-CTERM sorting domain-containing protein [Pseudomonadales bacterium]
MFKKLAVLLIPALIAPAASALLITDTHCLDYPTCHEPALIDAATSTTYSYTHDLTDDGFTPGVDFAKEAWLSIEVRTGNSPDTEIIRLNLGGGVELSDSVLVDHTPITFNVGMFAINIINDTGMLAVTVSADSGWFAFKRSDLTVAVPEPGTISLLGAMLLGLGLIRRRATS